jgi:hypothetical protein
MSKLLQAMLFPFMHTFQFGDGEVAAETPATEQSVAPESSATPADVPENPEAVAPKTFTEDELKAQLDAEAAKIRNKYERKLEKERIAAETRAQVLQEVAAKPVPKDDEPRVEDFTDYGDYLKAAARYEVKQELAQERANQQEQESKRSYEKENARREQLAEKLTENGYAKYPDFEEVAESTGDLLRSKGLKFSNAMMGALYEADNSHDIVYHLGKNLEEAERIASLPAYAQAKEIGKLEAKLAEKKPIKTSNAPDPIKPIEGGKNLTKKLEDMSYEEMLEHDRKRGARYLS